MPELRPLEDMGLHDEPNDADTGVLWAINRYLFHPRGFALTIDIGDDGKARGWVIQGDGSEPWAFDEEWDDRGHAAFERFLREQAETNRR